MLRMLSADESPGRYIAPASHRNRFPHILWRLDCPLNPHMGADWKRLNARDLRVLLLWLLAGLIGAGVAYRYFFHAFPEAAVNFKVTRGGGARSGAGVCDRAGRGGSTATNPPSSSMWTTTRRLISNAKWGWSRPIG